MRRKARKESKGQREKDGDESLCFRKGRKGKDGEERKGGQRGKDGEERKGGQRGKDGKESFLFLPSLKQLLLSLSFPRYPFLPSLKQLLLSLSFPRYPFLHSLKQLLLSLSFPFFAYGPMQCVQYCVQNILVNRLIFVLNLYSIFVYINLKMK